MSSLENRLLDLVADMFGLDPAELNPAMKAVEIDGWDSLGHVTFLSMVESTFDVTLPEEVKDRIAGLPDLLAALRKAGVA